jgi:hypothetical protein
MLVISDLMSRVHYYTDAEFITKLAMVSSSEVYHFRDMWGNTQNIERASS